MLGSKPPLRHSNSHKFSINSGLPGPFYPVRTVRGAYGAHLYPRQLRRCLFICSQTADIKRIRVVSAVWLGGRAVGGPRGATGAPACFFQFLYTTSTTLIRFRLFSNFNSFSRIKPKGIFKFLSRIGQDPNRLWHVPRIFLFLFCSMLGIRY